MVALPVISKSIKSPLHKPGGHYRNRGTAELVLNIDPRRRWDVNVTPWPLSHSSH